jgi:aminoglycoside phosphotransferase (APT) family kinase protein
MTLLHGDLATVNMAIEGDDLVLLDWTLATAGPGALDLGPLRRRLLLGRRARAGRAARDLRAGRRTGVRRHVDRTRRCSAA